MSRKISETAVVVFFLVFERHRQPFESDAFNEQITNTNTIIYICIIDKVYDRMINLTHYKGKTLLPL